MADDPIDKLGAKMDTITTQMQQVMVDIASIKATSHGDMENVKQRVSGLENKWDLMSKTLVTLIVGILVSVLAGLFMLLVQGKFHV